MTDVRLYKVYLYGISCFLICYNLSTAIRNTSYILIIDSYLFNFVELLFIRQCMYIIVYT